MRFNFGATLYHLNNQFARPSTKVKNMMGGTPVGNGPRHALDFHTPKDRPFIDTYNVRPPNGFGFKRWGR